MIRRLLLTVCVLGFAGALQAAVPTVVSTVHKAKFEFGKSSVILSAGTPLEVLAAEGDYWQVRYRKLQGRVLAADTDVPSTAGAPQAAPAAEEVTATPAPPPAKPAEAPKPVAAKPASPAPSPTAAATPIERTMTTNYGKAVDKARKTREKVRVNEVKVSGEVIDSDQPAKP